MKTTRCTDCAAEFSDEELEGVSACPTCGTKSLPSAIADDVDLRINWHELRILTIWASNHASEHLKDKPGSRTLSSIIKRLEAQFPDRLPLTIFGEIRHVSRELDTEVTLFERGTVTVIPKPDKN